MAKIKSQDVLEKLNFIEEITLNSLNVMIEKFNHMEYEKNHVSEIIMNEKISGIRFAIGMIEQFKKYAKNEIEKLEVEINEN